MTDANGKSSEATAPGAGVGPDEAVTEEPQEATPDDGPVGLWATGRAGYQQSGYSEPHTLPGQPVHGGQARRQGTWRSAGYRSSGARATIAIVLVALASVVDVASALHDVSGLGLLDQLVAGTVTDDVAASYDGIRGGLAQLFLFVYIASAIAVLRWLSRVVDNTPPLTGSTPIRSPREAIGWWFVPIASLVVPYQIVGDTSERLDPEGRGLGSLRIAWWLCFIGSSFLAAPVNALIQSDSIEGIKAMLAFSAASSLVTAVSGALLIVLVRRVERFSQLRVSRIAQAPAISPGGAPLSDPTSDQREHSVVVATADGPTAPPPPPAA